MTTFSSWNYVRIIGLEYSYIMEYTCEEHGEGFWGICKAIKHLQRHYASFFSLSWVPMGQIAMLLPP
jgi:hypothetical protein